MVRSVVVLPAPLVPISVTIWPCSTAKLIFLTALILPYETSRSFTSSIAVTSGPPLLLPLLRPLLLPRQRRPRRRCRCTPRSPSGPTAPPLECPRPGSRRAPG